MSTALRSTKHFQWSNDYRANMSKVHKKLTFLARGSKPSAGESERSGKREYWQRSTKHYQRSNDTKRFRRFAR